MGKQLDKNLDRLRSIEKVMMPISVILGAATAVGLFFYFKDLKIFDRIMVGLFAFIHVTRFVSGGIPKIIYHNKKVHRTLFLLLWPVGGTLVLYLLYQWWHMMWLAAILGLVLGFFISVFVGLLFFRDVAMEDQQREEKVADFIVEEDMMQNPDAVAMKERFTVSEWEDIKQFPTLVFNMMAFTAKDAKPVAKIYANAITKPGKYKDPLFRMMLLDLSADVTQVIGKLDAITRISLAATDKVLSSDMETLARDGKLSMGQEGAFTVKPEAMITIKNNLSRGEFRGFVRELFQFGMELVNARGKPDPQQMKMLIEFFGIFAESKQDLFSMLGIDKA